MFVRWSVFLFILAQLPVHVGAELVDLENGRQGFITETRQIHIPGHPTAFNPSIVRWHGTLLMSFREITLPSALSPWPYDYNAQSRIGLVWLDDDFQPIGNAQLLDIPRAAGQNQRMPSRSEDARLLVCGNSVYIVYSDNCEEMFSDGGFRVYVAEVQLELGEFRLNNIECLRCFEGENPHRREKNWAPFEYQQQLFLTYSLVPHRILRYLCGSGACETIACTGTEATWPWGELRGGTPAVPIDADHYLAFFHSCMDMTSEHSKGEWSLHYFVGAYLFNRNPPFKITKISPEPIVGPGFYHGMDYIPYWKPVRVVFPGGVLVEGEIILLAYGRQDHEIWIAQLDRQSLIDSLVDVN